MAVSPEAAERILSNIGLLKPKPAGLKASLRRLEGIKCVLFDVYGTMLISGTGDVGTASGIKGGRMLNKALEANGFILSEASCGERGVEYIEDAILSEHERGRRNGIEYPEIDIREIWTSVLCRMGAEGYIEGSVARETVADLAMEYECLVNPVWPMPGLESVLDGLRKNNITLGIVSNAQFYTKSLFNLLLGMSTDDLGFDPQLCIWSYELREAKPSIRLYEMAARALKERNIQSNQILYIGNDMLNDILPASASGFHTALFAGDGRSLRLRSGDERVTGINPDIIITDLPQVIDTVCPGAS